jgi:hypothetical protein
MDTVYQIEKNRRNSQVLAKKLISLRDLDADNSVHIDQNTIIQLFCNDLKSLLELTDLSELIKRLNHLDQLLGHLNDEEFDHEIPNLDDFFRTLSPILLRSVSQTLDSLSKENENSLQEDGEETLLMGWLESLRISIEEEIHIWQEKLI